MIILNFHGAGPVPRDMDDGERNCWLEKDSLERVLDLAAENSNVRLTVDDGNLSDSDVILPALLSRKLTAIFFVCSARIGQPTFLGKADIQGLLAKGMGIGSHGASHKSWRNLSAADDRAEMEGAKAELERVSGAAIDTAACPFGDYDARVLRRLRESGFRHAYTSDGGVANDGDFVLARTTVTRSTDLGELRRLVREGPGIWSKSVTDAKKLIKGWR